MMQNLKHLRVEDRPRERLQRNGVDSLTDQELITILLGSGTRGLAVHAVAGEVLAALNRHHDKLTLDRLMLIRGIGSARAAALLAALELARRRYLPRGTVIRSAADVVPLLAPWAGARQEHFITVTLNGAHEVLHTRVVTIGLVNTSQVHPREVFADAITDRACAIILAHNHPSGNLTPSSADRLVTQQLFDAGLLLGIPVLDHIIVSTRGHFSFEESALLSQHSNRENLRVQDTS